MRAFLLIEAALPAATGFSRENVREGLSAARLHLVGHLLQGLHAARADRDRPPQGAQRTRDGGSDTRGRAGDQGDPRGLRLGAQRPNSIGSAEKPRTLLECMRTTPSDLIS